MHACYVIFTHKHDYTQSPRTECGMDFHPGHQHYWLQFDVAILVISVYPCWRMPLSGQELPFLALTACTGQSMPAPSSILSE